MTVFGFEIRRRTRRVVMLEHPEMNEEELNTACRVSESHPFYRAVCQLLTTAARNAYINANAHIAENNKLAGYVAGAEHLFMLRDEIERRRELSLESFRRSTTRQILEKDLA